MPKTKTKRVGSDLKLARAIKPAGRITEDDRRRAAKVLSGSGLSAPQKRVLTNKLASLGKSKFNSTIRLFAAKIAAVTYFETRLLKPGKKKK